MRPSKTRLASGIGVLVLSASAFAQTVPTHPKPGNPEYGTTGVSYYRIPASEFSPLNDEPYATGTNYDRYSLSLPTNFAASPHLPDGALLVSVEFDFCDTSAGLTLAMFVDDIYWNGTFNRLIDYLPSPGGAPGCSVVFHDVSSAGFAVDNNFHQLTVRAVTSGSSSTSFTGAILGYKLQVSPDPETQTFADVPPSHPQHQFIEALARSGITAGCGGGNYCPNAALTRGQMAVFLAKALGLQWPQ